MKAKPDFEKIKEIAGDGRKIITGHSGEAWFDYKAEKMAQENGITKEAAQRSILTKRHLNFGEFINHGAVSKTEIKNKQDEKKDEIGSVKKKELKGKVLFYRSKEAKRIDSALKGSLKGGNLKNLQKNCEPLYKGVGNKENPVQADLSNQTEIKSVYEKKYIKYAPVEGAPKEKAKKKEFTEGLEALAKSAAEQLEVLKILNERVKDKLSIIEDSPDRDKKLQELITADPELGADLFKIMEINKHLRKEEKRWQRDMALPMRFREVGQSIKEDVGRGFFTSLVLFTGRFFKIAWQSAFLKGKKPEEKMRHFFKELTKETLETVDAELYYVGRTSGKVVQVGVAGAGKVANINRQSIEEGIKKAEKFRDETATLLRKALKEATNDRSMDTTN